MSKQDENEIKNNIELESKPKQENIEIEIKENNPQTTLLLDPNSQKELEPKKNYNFIIYFMICIIFYYCFFGNMNISIHIIILITSIIFLIYLVKKKYDNEKQKSVEEDNGHNLIEG
jgi:hypothetical protein